MEYKKLDELRNLYPSDEENIPNSFTSDNGVITYTGKYPENFIEFNIIPITDLIISDLKVDTEVSFRFIVEFEQNGVIENEKWTSQLFYDDLQKSIDDNNPYFNKDTVTTARVNFDKLNNYWTSPKFSISEAYAEVRILDTIKTKEDIIKHINWIVGSDEELRPVTTFGEWERYTSDIISDDTLGFPLSPEIDALANGELNGELPDGTPSPDNYYPFGVPGNYIGEIREYLRSKYTWTADSEWKKTR